MALPRGLNAMQFARGLGNKIILTINNEQGKLVYQEYVVHTLILPSHVLIFGNSRVISKKKGKLLYRLYECQYYQILI